jgi:hypothetical protein
MRRDIRQFHKSIYQKQEPSWNRIIDIEPFE